MKKRNNENSPFIEAAQRVASYKEEFSCNALEAVGCKIGSPIMNFYAEFVQGIGFEYVYVDSFTCPFRGSSDHVESVSEEARNYRLMALAMAHVLWLDKNR